MSTDKYAENAAIRLKETRESSGLNQKDFAAMFGVSPSTWCRYESGDIGKLKIPLIASIAKKFNFNPAWLCGMDEDKYIITEKAYQETKRLTVYGSFVPEIPIYEQKDIVDYVLVPKTNPADFCIKAPDNDMSGARILKGDTVYVKKQPEAVDGDIVLVEFLDEVVLRRLHLLVDKTEVLFKEEAGKGRSNSGEMCLVPILGVVVSFCSEV